MDQDAANPECVIAGMLGVLRLMAERFTAAFGAPAALIKGGALFGDARVRALRFLHDMECVLRRLLLLRAALFPAPAPRAESAPHKSSPRRAREGASETLFGPSEDPAQWRVHFAMPAPPEPRWMLGGFKPHEETYRLGHRVTAPAEAASLKDIGYWADDPRPLARRFEALLRVIADPDHYAARLAQRLYFWRGRLERRQLFLHAQCARIPVANEAGLEDAQWDVIAHAREMILALIHVFSAPRVCESP